MMQRQLLAHWFEEIRTTRTELTLELPLALPDALRGSIDEAIALSIAHIERVLDFSDLLEQQEENEEQADVDLAVRLEAYSYYAALAVPFLRQAVEGSVATGVASIEPWVVCDIPVSKMSARRLAKEMRFIKQSLGGVSDSSQFASWCGAVLICCAHLLLLHMTASGARPKQ
jgi:hypothetical protein